MKGFLKGMLLGAVAGAARYGTAYQRREENPRWEGDADCHRRGGRRSSLREGDTGPISQASRTLSALRADGVPGFSDKRTPCSSDSP